MDTQNKYCGNCKHFQNESATGNGWCNENDWISNVDKVCKCHEDIDNGWTEITPDNMDEVDCIPKDKVVVGWFYNKEFRSCSLPFFWFTLKSIVQQGGFYYYVLPDLKIE